MKSFALHKYHCYLGGSKQRFLKLAICGLYYKPMTMINDDARIIKKLDASLTDDARVIIYDHHLFIVQAIGVIVTCFTTI
jgi:hypothetical protein